jgi:hypothetical protein
MPGLSLDEMGASSRSLKCPVGTTSPVGSKTINDCVKTCQTSTCDALRTVHPLRSPLMPSTGKNILPPLTDVLLRVNWTFIEYLTNFSDITYELHFVLGVRLNSLDSRQPMPTVLQSGRAGHVFELWLRAMVDVEVAITIDVSGWARAVFPRPS